jgi:copper chaperone CopZ
MSYVTVTTEVDVEVDLNDIDIDEMIEHLEDNGYSVSEETEVSVANIVDRLRSIGDKRRMGLVWSNDFDTLLKDVLGRAF